MKTIILPGMGANSNMYPLNNYEIIENIHFINWPDYDGEQTFEEIAEKIINQHRIDQSFTIGGSSLGGMVAIEIAKITNIKKVILIGSATNPNFINPLLQKLSNLTEITPIKLIQTLTGKVNKSLSNEVLSMFEESNEKFIRAMCKALFRWEGLGNYNCKYFQIHGEKDMVIFPPKKNVKIISGGGHLISMSHADEVATFININK